MTPLARDMSREPTQSVTPDPVESTTTDTAVPEGHIEALLGQGRHAAQGTAVSVGMDIPRADGHLQK